MNICILLTSSLVYLTTICQLRRWEGDRVNIGLGRIRKKVVMGSPSNNFTTF
jgi:hypothetical protein